MLEQSSNPSQASPHSEYYINVPQGRGARLELNSLAYTSGKIVGLNTHDFSICNIWLDLQQKTPFSLFFPETKHPKTLNQREP